jgi:hypothetical protein
VIWWTNLLELWTGLDTAGKALLVTVALLGAGFLYGCAEGAVETLAHLLPRKER